VEYNLILYNILCAKYYILLLNIPKACAIVLESNVHNKLNVKYFNTKLNYHVDV